MREPMTPEQYQQIQQTKETIETELPSLKVTHRVRKLAHGNRLYFRIVQSDSLGGGFDSKRMQIARKIIRDQWPDALMTSGGTSDCTVAAGWLTTNEPSPRDVHRENIKQAVDQLKDYINSYTGQSQYADYPYKTLIYDIVYGLGIAVGGSKFSGPDGFRRWKRVLTMILDGSDMFEPSIDDVDRLLNDSYDPMFGDDRICKCGHPYDRHFDSFDEMAPVGCKYCTDIECPQFEEERFEER